MTDSAYVTDDAVICATIERQLAHWQDLRESQGHTVPDCAPMADLRGVRLRDINRLERAGLIEKTWFEPWRRGGRGLRLTATGEQLAQDAHPMCERCFVELGGAADDADRCGPCRLVALEWSLARIAGINASLDAGTARAEERARIVKALRESAHGGNRGQPGSFWVGWRAAARAIEEGWAEKPETDT